MVRQIFTAVLGFAIIGSELIMPAYASSRAMVVTITENGARSNNVSGDETPALCSAFTLTKSDVEQFFRQSKRVTARDYNHDLEMSRCYAAGRVSYPNGSRGRWWIDMERRGLLILNNGQRTYYYCRACTSSRFDVPYDPAIDG